MMGTAGTDSAASYREARRQIALAKEQAKLERYKAQTAAKTARWAAGTDKIDTSNVVAIQRAQTETAQIVTPIQAQATADLAEAASQTERQATIAAAKAKLIAALPWVLGGALAIGGFMWLRRRRA